MFKEIDKNIKIRLFLNFISKLAMSTILPFIVVYYSQVFNQRIAGIFVMITMACQIVSTIYSGYVTDKIGRLPLMKIGEICKLFCFLLMIVFSNPLIFFLLITFVSIAQGIINPAMEAMLIDNSTVETRTKIVSMNYWINNLAILLGTIIGGALFYQHFLLIRVLLFLSSIFICYVLYMKLKETAGTVSKDESKGISLNYLSILKNKKYLLYFLGSICIFSVELQRNNYIVLSLPKSIEVSGVIFSNVSLMSFLTSINTILVILFLPLVIKKFSKKNLKTYLFTSVIIFSLGYSVLSLSNIFFVLLIATIAISAGELLYTPASQTVFLESIEDTKKGMYLAINSLGIQIAQILAGGFLIVTSYFSRSINSSLIFMIGIMGLLLLMTSYTTKNMESVKETI